MVRDILKNSKLGSVSSYLFLFVLLPCLVNGLLVITVKNEIQDSWMQCLSELIGPLLRWRSFFHLHTLLGEFRPNCETLSGLSRRILHIDY